MDEMTSCSIFLSLLSFAGEYVTLQKFWKIEEIMKWCLFQLVERPEFADMIREDAGNVAARQETDSIPLVDEIRFHIASNVQTYSAIEEANQKLSALELLLASIGLECWETQTLYMHK